MTNPAPPAAIVPKPADAAARRFAIDAARLAAQTRCVNVVVLDVSRVSPITDFLVLGTGSSGRQMKAVASELEDLGDTQDFKTFGRDGHGGDSWLLSDFVTVVAHLFSPEARGYYDLDGLWGDADVVDWQTGAPPPPNALPGGNAFEEDADGFAPFNPATAESADADDEDEEELAGDDEEITDGDDEELVDDDE